MMHFRVEVVEDCTELLPYPNGGCRRIKVRPAKSDHWTEWYTFGDALEE